MIKLDPELKAYLDVKEENKEFFDHILLKKKILIVPSNLKEDISDLIDVINKFKEVRGIFEIINTEKCHLEEITNLLEQTKVLEKILNIIIEDPAYKDSFEKLLRFDKLLSSIIVHVDYISEISRIPFGNVLQKDKKYTLAIDQESFLSLIAFLRKNFSFTDHDEAIEEIDSLVVELVTILALINKELSFNTLYEDNQFLLNKFLQLKSNFPIFTEEITVLLKESFFLPEIDDIIKKITDLQIKLTGKKELKIHNWDKSKYGLEDLGKLLSNFG